MGSHDIARPLDRDIKCLVDFLANFVTPLGSLYLYNNMHALKRQLT